MPTMADITIKKDDGTTNVTYTAVVAAGGDKSPAVWRDNGFGGTPGQRPEVRCTSQSTADNSGRKMTINFTYPSLYTDASTGLTKVGTRANAKVELYVPAEMPDAFAAEFGAQFGNLLAADLIEACMTAGYAPA